MTTQYNKQYGSKKTCDKLTASSWNEFMQQLDTDFSQIVDSPLSSIAGKGLKVQSNKLNLDLHQVGHQATNKYSFDLQDSNYYNICTIQIPLVTTLGAGLIAPEDMQKLADSYNTKVQFNDNEYSLDKLVAGTGIRIGQELTQQGQPTGEYTLSIGDEYQADRICHTVNGTILDIGILIGRVQEGSDISYCTITEIYTTNNLIPNTVQFKAMVTAGRVRCTVAFGAGGTGVYPRAYTGMLYKDPQSDEIELMLVEPSISEGQKVRLYASDFDNLVEEGQLILSPSLE